ncbi:MAG TPA: hypothetical protein VGH87_21850, partial [Polyangiaceae bacterium]
MPAELASRDGANPARDVVSRESEARARQLLSSGTPREILCRIVQGDPLGMRDRAARALHSSAYLLDADRVQLRSLARCARFAARCSSGDFDQRLDEIVNEAIEDLLREDGETDHELDPGSAPGAAFVALARPLGLEPEAMRRACASFNRLPKPDRKAFFELVIDGAPLDELARRGGESASEIARRARKALDLLLSAQAGERKPAENERKAAVNERPPASNERKASDHERKATDSAGKASERARTLNEPRPEPSSRESHEQKQARSSR